MSEVVAVVGSRSGADVEHVERFLRELHARFPGNTLVSGGNRSSEDSVDHVAEQLWLGLGGHVISFRPKKLREDHWIIEKWEGAGGQFRRVTDLIHEPSFGDFRSAAIFRDMLIAELADRVVVFYEPGKSPGSAFTAETGRVENKPVYEFERSLHVVEP